MTSWRLIAGSLRHYWRTHLGVLLGAALGTTVLLGALLVGDSVRASLLQMAQARLGQVSAALLGNDRFFHSDLATALTAELDAATAPILLLPGTAARGDGGARANRIQVVGVSSEFWKLGPSPSSEKLATHGGDIPSDTVWVNEPLARQLGIKVGESVIVRVPQPSMLSRDAPLSPTEDTSLALRLTVGRILQAADFGRFSFQASQLPTLNAFVGLKELQLKLGQTNQANGLISSFVGANSASQKTGTQPRSSLSRLDEIFRAQVKLADLGLQLLPLTHGQTELRTPRVFLDSPVIAAAKATGLSFTPIFTYFANELRVGSRTTPYSMVTALPPRRDAGEMGRPSAVSLLPSDFKDNEVMINSWLAEDLQAKPGDSLELTYYIVGAARQLVEQRTSFRVHSIVSIDGAAGDRTLMPDFPGMSDAENCRDWDTGFPIKTDAIREKDEDYWKKYRGTPKAFISLRAGQSMWSNRFGDLTSLRFEVGAKEVETALRRHLNPASLGLSFMDVRAQAQAASTQGQDFGQLFLGFSFFLILSALMLMALVFRFSLEQRTVEMGLLLALGFTPRRVRWLLMGEGALIAFLGGMIGLVGGVGYARAMLYGLSTLWRSAVGTTMLVYDARLSTLLIGAASSVSLAVFTIFWIVRREAQRPAHALLQETGGARLSGSHETRGRGKATLWAGIVSFVMGAVLTGMVLVDRKAATAGMFFSTASLVLIGGLCFISWWLIRDLATNSTTHLSLIQLGLRNVCRRIDRSRAIVILLASGSFLIASIGIFRIDAARDGQLHTSGTGGYAFVGESALPIVQDLNATSGRELYNLDATLMAPVTVLPFRLREGDDASCLNLNRAQKPRLLGVSPIPLAQRKAFTFAAVEVGSTNQPWHLLSKKLANGEIPAIADANSIQWALGKKLGDTLPYTDEQGRTIQLRLVGAVANSILQGALIISEDNFLQLFPSESGYRFFLIDKQTDGGKASIQDTAAHLTKALQEFGLELTPTVDRLNALNAVQNTYLNTFQILGGLGLLLGSFGLGIVVLRNVLERRNELGLLQAVGVGRTRVLGLVMGEHVLLLGLGLALGIFAAAIAVLPAALVPGAQLPLGSLAMTLSGVGVFGAFATYAAALYALRGRLIDALRSE